ncbi:M20/M25/M40 family metallo-hydrolase [candidate division TA06 bacterium]|uniref:M20/M25/M40 family metallo-hydrolase n=1 Tax=candidate division TA06 bacterium TaxID=2250710 RepID=A0A933IFY9_UNCT6|nr:M20/M25/M40 family metallo-hydrolase [candidate division TA06 bacterium]
MKTRNLLTVVLALLTVSAVTSLASPVDLYLVKFAPGTDVYRLAGSQNWPVYHIISGHQALVGKKLSGSDHEAVLESNQIYQGPSENLRWVHLKRNSQLPAIKALYAGKDMLLTDAGNVAAAGIKSGRDYMVKFFNPRPMVISPAAIIRNSGLARDTAVATLVHQVDTAQVRTRIEALQSFNTRFLDAANHDSVVGWIRNQFLGMGIADVRLDTFDIGFGAKQHNIIATIPGLLDTSVVYIVGGHYDSYSPERYTQAPGADDNASGTVAAMEMARVLAQPGNRPNFTVRFIAFDAEEYGLYGSEYYAQKAVSEGMDIGCMLNYDMIGYKGNDSVFVSKLYTGSESYAYLLGQMAGWYGRLADTNLVPEYNSVYLNGSDSWEFSIRGFPVTYSEELEFSTVYHQTNDSTTYMSMRYVTSIIKAGMGLLGTLANYPQKVDDVTASDIGTGTELAVQWTPNAAANIAGYNIYYGNASGYYPNSQYTTAVTDTISGLASNINCYITVRAVDSDGRESPVASEVIGVPVLLGLDQGVLVVDETYNWTTGNLPRDAQQDSFYNYILTGYKYEQHEYGSSLQKPTLADLGPYSTVAWFADDYSQMLASGAVNDIKLYLENGGKMWFAGWKPSSNIGSALYDYFKMSYAGVSGTADSFNTAVGLKGYQNITVDTLKYPSTIWGKTFRYIEALAPLAGADTIYVIDMKNDGSPFEGKACAVRDSGKTVFFGFPLYFMDREQVKTAAQKIMAEFGEPFTGVSGKPELPITNYEFRLYQNNPNPFAQLTIISYQLAKSGLVSLKVYNVAGQLVRVLDEGYRISGAHSIKWDGRDEGGLKVSNGVYVYRLEAGGIKGAKKMLLLR